MFTEICKYYDDMMQYQCYNGNVSKLAVLEDVMDQHCPITLTL